MSIKAFVCVLFLIVNSFAQFTFPLAPEVWSKPEKLLPDSISVGYPRFSLTPNGDTLVYCNQFVKYFYKDSIGNWRGPQILSPLYGIPNYSPDYAVFTPDRKTLYFTDARSWKMYKCRFNETTKQWQTPETFFDNGFNQTPFWIPINFLDDTTMFLVGDSKTRLARLRDSIWYPNPGFPKPWESILFTDGLWMHKTGLRVYQGLGSNSNRELYINYYYDTVTNSQATKILNISKMSDSLLQTGEYQGRSEYFPYLTVDRKKMVLLANYHGEYRYYISYLLVDENGDTILTSANDPPDIYRGMEYRLMQNYPNPFNPSTTINYGLPKKSYVSIKVYDILGRLIQILHAGEQPAGSYTLNFDGTQHASGIYFYELKADNYFIVKKMNLLK